MKQIIQKYRNKKTKIQGITFDSKLEANVYLKILELQKSYDFKFELQPKYVLLEKFRFNGKAVREISYVADFLIYVDNAKEYTEYVIDTKGIETPVFKMKRKMFQKKFNQDIILIKSVKKFCEWFKEVMK